MLKHQKKHYEVYRTIQYTDLKSTYTQTVTVFKEHLRIQGHIKRIAVESVGRARKREWRFGCEVSGTTPTRGQPCPANTQPVVMGSDERDPLHLKFKIVYMWSA